MQNQKILVVEDDQDLQKLLQFNLQKEGYGVLLAGSGEEGLELAVNELPGLVVLDLMLPRLDGFEVCRLLKSEEKTRQIPVLMLTAKNAEADQVVGLELGAADYLTKPFSMKVLSARIKNILRAKDSDGDGRTVLRQGDFALDVPRVLFTVNGRPVSLTKKEFEILATLMRRPGIVRSRPQLVRSVWGEGAQVTAAALNMQIKSLRQKLGDHGRYVETVRGSGYRFLELS